MAEVFAGFVSGYVLALITTPLCAVWIVRIRARSELMARLLPAGVSAVSLAVILHGGLFALWTGLGMALGLVLLGMRGAGSAAGSLNAPYSLFVAGLTLAMVAPLAVLLPRLRAGVMTGALVVLLVFGWLMPYLARWSTFDS